MDFLIMLSAVILGNLIYQLLFTMVFVAFRVDRYEDTLAKKISKEVNNGKF